MASEERPVVIRFTNVTKEYKLFKSDKARFISLFSHKKNYKIKRAIDSLSFELHKGESLGLLSDSLAGITITAITKSDIELSNGQTKHVGDEFAADIYATSYQEHMLRLAIQRHFETERKLFHRESKIKTLALFFIDNIESFRGDDKGGNAWLRELFDRNPNIIINNDIFIR